MSTISTLGAPAGGRRTRIGGNFVSGSLALYVVSVTGLRSGIGRTSRDRSSRSLFGMVQCSLDRSRRCGRRHFAPVTRCRDRLCPQDHQFAEMPLGRAVGTRNWFWHSTGRTGVEAGWLRDRDRLPASVQPHFGLVTPRGFLVPELHAGEIAFTADEIEHRADTVGPNPDSKWVRTPDMIPVFDDDAIELHGGSPHAELERRVRLLAVAADLVVIGVPLDFLGAEVLPRRSRRVNRARGANDQQRSDE